MLFAGQIDLTHRLNAIQDGLLVFGRIANINALRPVLHFHRQYENGERYRRQYANDKGVHIEKLLVPTQGIAPEMVKKTLSGIAPGSGWRLYNIRPTGTSPRQYTRQSRYRRPSVQAATG